MTFLKFVVESKSLSNLVSIDKYYSKSIKDKRMEEYAFRIVKEMYEKQNLEKQQEYERKVN